MNMYLFAGREPGSEREIDCEIFSGSYDDALEQAKNYFGPELSEITLIKVERDDNEPAPKVLNLYAGIGGNRKHWKNCEVTAVEYTQVIADVYQELNPKDTVIVGDAHQYLLDHYEEFDFIWSSPPCQSHSKLARYGRNKKPKYPDMRLYEQIIFLHHNFKGKWVVENVQPYYKEMIPCQKIGRHLFWANFDITPIKAPQFKNMINSQNLKEKAKLMAWLGIHYEKNIYYDGNHCPTQILRNCVHPNVGLSVFNDAIAKEAT